ncbi:MAG: hypothetical protein AAF721_16160 [Myxococcota bacterium]
MTAPRSRRFACTAPWALAGTSLLSSACFSVPMIELDTEGASDGAGSGTASAISATQGDGPDDGPDDGPGDDPDDDPDDGPDDGPGDGPDDGPSDGPGDGTTSTGGMGSTGDGMSETGDDTAGDESTTGPAVPCDALINQCVPPVPDDWTGPVVGADLEAGSPLPPCGGNFPTEVGSYHTGLNVPASDCDCDCDSPTGFSCDAGTVTRHSLASCAGTETTINLDANICVATNWSGWFDMTSDPPTGGSCNPTLSETIPETSWTTDARICAGTDTGDACPGDGICVPNSGDPFSPDICIARAGDVPCPAGAYINRTLLHADLDDTRECTTCTCGDVTGNCNGLVNLYSGANCNGLVGGVGGPNCNSAGGNTVLSTRFTTPNPIVSCEPQGGEFQGDAVETEPLTICCL